MKYCIFSPEIHDRFGPNLQCIFTVSVMLLLKIVVVLWCLCWEKKNYLTCTEGFHESRYVRTISPRFFFFYKYFRLGNFVLILKLKRSQQFRCENDLSAILGFLICEHREVTSFHLSMQPLIYEEYTSIFHDGPLTALLLVTIWLKKKYVLLNNMVC